MGIGIVRGRCRSDFLRVGQPSPSDPVRCRPRAATVESTFFSRNQACSMRAAAASCSGVEAGGGAAEPSSTGGVAGSAAGLLATAGAGAGAGPGRAGGTAGLIFETTGCGGAGASAVARLVRRRGRGRVGINHLGDIGVTLLQRQDRGGGSVGINHRGIGPAREQKLGHVALAGGGGVHQRRLILLDRLVHWRARVEQRLGDFLVTEQRRDISARASWSSFCSASRLVFSMTSVVFWWPW